MMMPEMDGQATIKTLRCLDPDIKIIISSGLPLSQFSGLEDSGNIQARLQKPYTTQELLTTLHRVLLVDQV